MPENLWEQAKATLYGAEGATDDPVIRKEIGALLAEMERVECVEGWTVEAIGIKPTEWVHTRAKVDVDDWRAVLLLLPEVER